MRRALLLLLAGVAAGALPVVGAEPAAACSCAPLGDDGSFAAADAVFTGTVAGVEQQGPPLESGRSAAIWTFAVDRVFKGSAAATTRVASASDGGSCGLELRRPDGTPASGSAPPVPVLVFATGLPAPARLPHDDIRLVAHLCNGTRTLADAPIPTSFGPGEPPQPPGLGLPVAPPEASPPPPPPSPRPGPGGGPSWWLVAAVGGAAAVGGGIVGAGLTRRRRRTPGPAQLP